MTRDETRRLVQSPDFIESSTGTTDRYEFGLTLDFDENERLQFIEVSEPSSAKLDDIEFFVDELETVLEKLRMRDPDVVSDVGSYFAPSLGVSAYAPRGEVLSASVHTIGYYDE